MRVTQTLRPGQHGTRRFQERFGDRLVCVRVVWGEAEVARRVKRAGGTWDDRRKVWRLRAGAVRQLGPGDRMVRLDGPQTGRDSLDVVTRHYI